MEERTLEYEKLVITKAFVTEPKHRHRRTSIDIRGKGSVVYEKCRQLTDLAIEKYPEGNVPDSQLTYWVMHYCGADKATLRAYKGYEGYIEISKSGEGRLVGQKRTGYIERFGFMRRMNRTKWRVSQTFLPAYPPSLNNEESFESKEKISLSSPVVLEDSVARSSQGPPLSEETVESREAAEKEEEYREREKFAP